MPLPILLFVQMHHEKSCQAKIMLMSANSQYITISTCMHEYIQQTTLRVDLIFYDCMDIALVELIIHSQRSYRFDFE